MTPNNALKTHPESPRDIGIHPKILNIQISLSPDIQNLYTNIPARTKIAKARQMHHRPDPSDTSEGMTDFAPKTRIAGSQLRT